MPEALSPPLLLIIGLVLLALDVLLFGGASVILPILAVAVFAAGAAGAMGLDAATQITTGAVAGLLSVPLIVLLSRRLRRAHGAASDDQQLLQDTFTIEYRGTRPGIRHRGDFLSARREDHAALARGDTVRVLRIEGVTAIVAPAERQL